VLSEARRILDDRFTPNAELLTQTVVRPVSQTSPDGLSWVRFKPEFADLRSGLAPGAIAVG